MATSKSTIDRFIVSKTELDSVTNASGKLTYTSIGHRVTERRYLLYTLT